MKNKSYQTGMTLIEIMIALLIGAFLLGGVLQIFIGSKQTYRMQEGLSRLQENGRFALDFLARDIRMAGYWGCLVASSPDEDVAGTEGALGASDTVTLKGAFVRTPTGACGTSVINAATIACPKTADPVNFYTDTTSIITYSIVSDTLRRATNCISNGSADIVEGIENMQILYGADTNADNTPDYYVPAGTVGLNMAQVVSIRISLLAATLDDNLAAQPLAYTYNGVTSTPTDRKIRRVFNTTIAVRNRLP